MLVFSREVVLTVLIGIKDAELCKQYNAIKVVLLSGDDMVIDVLMIVV